MRAVVLGSSPQRSTFVRGGQRAVAVGQGDADAASPRSTPRALTSDPGGGPGLVEGVVDLRRVLAAGHGEVGALPPPPLTGLGRLGDQLARVEAAVGRDGGDQADAAALGRADDDHGPDAGAVADGDGEVAQVVAVEAVDPGHDDAVDGRGGQRRRPGPWPPGA